MLRLSRERERRGWSKARLARTAHIDQALLSKLESGRVRPYPPELRRLAKALGLPRDCAEELLEEVGGL